jgi:hypothetical protein
MAKYISSIDLAHYSNLTYDEVVDVLSSNALCEDEIPRITQSDYELIKDEFDESSQRKIEQYFGSQSDVKYQFDLLGGFTEVKPKKAKEKVIPKRTWEEPDYLPNLEESLNYQYKFFKDISQPQDEELIFDIEIYGNYFLIMFLGYRTGRCWYFEKTDEQELDIQGVQWFINNHTLVSFNGIKFDLPLLQVALAGKGLDDLWKVTELLINDENGLRPYQVVKQFKGVKLENIDHIDLIEVAPLKGSLKLYGARLHTPNLQDLPFKVGINLNDDQISIVRRYCLNDVETTAYLYNKLIPNVELRKSIGKQYGFDARSKSDAQIGEAIIKIECELAAGKKFTPNPERMIPFVTVKRWDFIKFKRNDLQEIYDKVTSTKFDVINGIVQAGFMADLAVDVGGSTIRLSIGGVHSSEENISYYEDEEYELIDVDVASMYPSWIINRGLYPKLIGSSFLKVYTSVKERRIEAKKNKDKITDAALKIASNATYGKTASKYSVLYEPELMLSTTTGGQMCILMIAERFEEVGFHIVQVNTDGLCIKIKRTDRELLNSIVKQWELETSYVMEYTHYKSIHSRDVNNYFSVKTNGELKRKGAYSEESLVKNPQNNVCADAVANYLLGMSTIEDYVTNCIDIRKFLTIRNVTGGAIKDVEYLGKTIRFYHSISTNTSIMYANSGNNVPTSEKCRPLMKLTLSIPVDLDYDWYINEAYSILKDIGVKYEKI